MSLHQTYKQKYESLQGDIIKVINAQMDTENLNRVEFKEHLILGNIETPDSCFEGVNTVIIGIDSNDEVVNTKLPTNDEDSIYLTDLEIHQLIWVMKQLETGQYTIIEEQEEV